MREEEAGDVKSEEMVPAISNKIKSQRERTHVYVCWFHMHLHL